MRQKAYGRPVFGTVADAKPVAETTHGKIRGENRDGVAIFRGIPYGDACDGKRRFLPPQPARDWEGIRDCTVNGPYAMQQGKDIVGTDDFGPYFSGGHPEQFGVKNQKQDENCLVLNVLTPGMDSRKRPVVVYIHGGGFATGSGTLVLGADRWVREEDLVVVGVNHRLNVFGYLYLGDFDEAYRESGMAGILDLVLALRWVQENIEAFGGDPGNVTIMGESGGGDKVSILLAMPEAQELFARAIVESGSSPIGRMSGEEGMKLAEKLLETLGLTRHEWRKLLEIPASQLIAAALGDGGGEGEAGEHSMMMKLCPVADGIHLNYNDKEQFIFARQALQKELLVGASEDELAAFLPVKELPITEENLEETLRAYLAKEEQIPKEQLTSDRIRAVLKAFCEFDEKEMSPLHLYINILSQISWLGGGSSRQAAAKAEQGNGAVYSYLIRYDAPHPVYPELRYSWHTADLPLQMRIVLHAESEELSRKMAHCWAAFIRTGNPSTEEISWPAFTVSQKETMLIDEEWSSRNNPMKKIHEAIDLIFGQKTG